MLIQHIKVGDLVVHTGVLYADRPGIAIHEEFTNEEQHIILVVGVGEKSLYSNEDVHHLPLLYTKNSSYAHRRDRHIMLIGFLLDRLYRIYTSPDNLAPPGCLEPPMSAICRFINIAMKFNVTDH